MAYRDSGYKQAPSGNVAVDFVWGNLPGQTNDDRSGSSISYNATGGTAGGYSTDSASASVTAASASAGTITYTANNEFVAGQQVTITGLNGTVSITGITASAGVVTYATASTTGLSAGQTITVSGASTSGFNGTFTILAVTANTNFTVTSAATGSTSTATGTYSSAFNLSNATIATVSSSNFTVTSAVTDRAVSGATGGAAVILEYIDGIGADLGWSTTTDYTSNVLTETQPTKAVGQAGSYTVPADNVVNILNNYEAFPLNAGSKTTGFNPAYTLQAKITGVTYSSAAQGTLVFTANNNFSNGQTVSISGLYNYVSAGSTQPIATQYYAPTYTVPSYFNAPLKAYYPVTDANGNSTTGFGQYNASYVITAVTSTTFTITGTASSLTITADPTLTTLTGVNGLATVTVAASASTGTVPTVTGLTIKEAARLIGVNNFNVGTITYTTSGATVNNAGTVYSQGVTGSQTLGTAVNLVIYRLPTGENPGTQVGTFTYTN